MLKERFMILRAYKRMNALDVYKTVQKDNRYSYPESFWEECIRDERVAIVRYFVEELLKWDEETLFNNLSNSTFKEYGLARLLTAHYNGKFFNAIRDAYPTKYKPWQFKNNPINWNLSKGIEATRWLILSQLKMTIGQVYTKLNQEQFSDYNLEVMLDKVFGGSIPKAVKASFPEKKIITGLFFQFR